MALNLSRVQWWEEANAAQEVVERDNTDGCVPCLYAGRAPNEERFVPEVAGKRKDNVAMFSGSMYKLVRGLADAAIWVFAT